MQITIPPICSCQSASLVALLLIVLTKVSNKVCPNGVRRPLAVHYIAVCADLEPIPLITLHGDSVLDDSSGT